MYFLKIHCNDRGTDVHLDVNKIVQVQKMEVAGSPKKNICFIFLDKDYDGKGHFEVSESAAKIVMQIEELRVAALSFSVNK